MSYITIVPIETSTLAWQGPVIAGIEAAFGMQVKNMQGRVSLREAFDHSRRQYNSSKILLQLLGSLPAEGSKILGVTEVDLFIPILTFVFGEAQLKGAGAVVSMHRLNNKFYGLPEDPELLMDRLVKESIHELGHTFGLIHCSHPECVMASSTYAEDIDQKSRGLCMHCRQDLAVI